MDTLVIVMVPFGIVALLAVAGAAKAGVKAVDEADTLRRTELGLLCALLVLTALLCMGGAWWWWRGWQDFGF
jgi:hypothetical protein